MCTISERKDESMKVYVQELIDKNKECLLPQDSVPIPLQPLKISV